MSRRRASPSSSAASQRGHSFAAVRRFYTPYQLSVRAASGRYGFYAPWAVKRPHGMPMRGTPFLRASCAILGPAC